MHLNYDLTFFAEIDAARGIKLRGARAHGHYLLRLEIGPVVQARTASEAVRLLWLWGKASIAGEVIGTLLPESSTSLQTATTAYVGHLCLTTDLDLMQVERLNAARGADGSLLMYFSLYGFAHGPLGVKAFAGDDSVKFTTEQWTSFLQESGYGNTFLIEVVEPTATPGSTLEGGVSHLRRALERHLDPRGSHDALGACRVALDTLGEQAWALPSGVQLKFADGRSKDDLSKEERLRILRWAVRQLTHLGPHPDAGPVSSQDAKLLIQLTASLLAHDYPQRRS